MLDERQLKEKRKELEKRINQLETAIPQMQQEAIARRGQVLFIDELLGEGPPPQGPPVEVGQKPKPKPPRKRSKAHGR